MVAKQPVLQRTLVTLIVRTLRPIARIALRHCMSCLEFEDIARWVFVDVALNDPLLSLSGRGRQFKSRAAILTGLSRKEVMRLSHQPTPGDGRELPSRNRAARVVAGWLLPPYVDGRGAPKVLPIKGGSESFLGLVRKCGGDVPYRAILDELLDNGVVERVNGKGLRLKSKGKLYPRGSHDALQKAGDGLDSLLAHVEKHLHSDIQVRR